MSDEMIRGPEVRVVQVDGSTTEAIVAGVTKCLRAKEETFHLPLGEIINWV